MLSYSSYQSHAPLRNKTIKSRQNLEVRWAGTLDKTKEHLPWRQQAKQAFLRRGGMSKASSHENWGESEKLTESGMVGRVREHLSANPTILSLQCRRFWCLQNMERWQPKHSIREYVQQLAQNMLALQASKYNVLLLLGYPFMALAFSINSR